MTNKRKQATAIRKGVEYLGTHPLVTGVLAILGLLGLVLSIIGYMKDRNEAEVSTDLTLRIEKKIDTITPDKIVSSSVSKTLYYYYKTNYDPDHCWALPLINVRNDGSFEFDIFVEAGANDELPIASRFRGHWEQVMNFDVFTFEGETPYLRQEDFRGVQIIDDKSFSILSKSREIYMWNCTVEKKNTIKEIDKVQYGDMF